MSKDILKLKIGRETYDINRADRFLDNGVCVQLLTRPLRRGFSTSYPVLSKLAIKEIAAFDRVEVDGMAFSIDLARSSDIETP